MIKNVDEKGKVISVLAECPRCRRRIPVPKKFKFTSVATVHACAFCGYTKPTIKKPSKKRLKIQLKNLLRGI